MSIVYLGIDPGVTGAVAIICASGTVEFYDPPTRKLPRGHAYLPAEMVTLLRPYAGQAFAALEEAQAPRLARGVGSGNITSAFKIGQGFGLWEMALTALGIPYEILRPDAWKKALRLPPGSDKEASRARAQALFPQVAERLQKGRARPDLAEALLIAEVGRRRHQGETGG